MFFSFGLWNVLLLPFSLRDAPRDRVRVRPPGGPDVGRLRRSARSSWPASRASCRSPTWIVVSTRSAMGICGVLLRPVDPRSPLAIAAGHDLGLLQLAVVGRRARSCCSGTRRARCAAGCSRRSTSCATSIFLFGMAGAGLADVLDIRVLIVVRLVAAVRVGGLHAGRARASASRPGARRAARLARRGAAPALAGSAGRGRRRSPTSTGWPAASATFARLSPDAARRPSSATATVREVPAGTRIVEHGDAASSAYFILDGSTTAGIPGRRRLPRACRR